MVKAPPSAALFTAEELRASVGLTTEEYDAELSAFLESVTAAIDGPDGIGYALMRQTWTLSLPGFGSSIALPGAPVKAIEAVRYLDLDGEEQTLDPALYRLELGSRPARFLAAPDAMLPPTLGGGLVPGAVRIDYELGEATAAAVSGRAKALVRGMIAQRFRYREVTDTKAHAEVPFGVRDDFHALNQRGIT
jgi:uncharacterized phiE125 gp8 family phage protein